MCVGAWACINKLHTLIILIAPHSLTAQMPGLNLVFLILSEPPKQLSNFILKAPQGVQDPGAILSEDIPEILAHFGVLREQIRIKFLQLPQHLGWNKKKKLLIVFTSASRQQLSDWVVGCGGVFSSLLYRDLWMFWSIQGCLDSYFVVVAFHDRSRGGWKRTY